MAAATRTPVRTWRTRPAGPADFAFAWRVYRETMRPLTEAVMPWDAAGQRGVVRRALAAGTAEVVEDAGARVGWLQVREDEESLGLVHIYLAPGARGRGLGSALLARLAARADAAGKPVCLTVLRHNRARRLYGRLGFRVTGGIGPELAMRREPR